MEINIKHIILKNIENIIPKNKLGRKPKYNNFQILDSIYFILKTGCQWRELNKLGINYSTVFRHFKLWKSYNIFYTSWIQLLTKNKNKLNLNVQSIDCSFIKSIFGIDKIGATSTDRGRNSTKMSLLVEGNGIPLSVFFDNGNKHDIKLFKPTLDKSQFKSNKKFFN